MLRDKGFHKIMGRPFIGIVRLLSREMLGLNTIWLFIMLKEKACHKIMGRPFIGIVRLLSREMLGLSTI